MSIEAMRQALEALDEAANVLTSRMFADAAAALREAIEQAEEPVALPCCSYTDASAIKWNPLNGVVQCHNCGQTYIPPAAQEPVAWGDVKIRPDGRRYCRAVYTTDQSNAGCLPLYTTPPAATTKKEKE
jgi:hypothetical protein